MRKLHDPAYFNRDCGKCDQVEDFGFCECHGYIKLDSIDLDLIVNRLIFGYLKMSGKAMSTDNEGEDIRTIYLNLPLIWEESPLFEGFIENLSKYHLHEYLCIEHMIEGVLFGRDHCHPCVIKPLVELMI